MSRTDRINEIESQLEALEYTKKLLLSELATLRAAAPKPDETPLIGVAARSVAPSTPEEKVDLFIELFKARATVFPKLWENPSKGTKGYSPVCRNEWVRDLCDKPKIKCTECPNQAFAPLDRQAIRDHLQGRMTIGTYAITENDQCRFVAADFDGDSWQSDVIAYRQAATELGIEAAVEKSRSGNGAHAWIFFSEPVEAAAVRQLGTLILSRSQSIRSAMSLSSYDRLFPNQDTLPKGGFGNLIALPLQFQARANGNTVFLDVELNPIEDQWAYLGRIRRLSRIELNEALRRYLKNTTVSLVPSDDVSVSKAERALDAGRDRVVAGMYPERIDVELGSQISIETVELPSALLAAFKRTATFANPKFFELQRMRFSTWKTPRFIFCGELDGTRLVLPRGCLDACLDIAKRAGSSVVLSDTRPNFKRIKATFKGELLPSQQEALKTLSKHEFGVLVAPPGSGKTVIACAMISKRKTPTLILVHRSQLLEQWRDRLSEFLGIDRKEIGTFEGARKKQTHIIDVGMLPSLSKVENPSETLAGYGQVIIDECHHIPAVSFESVLKSIPVRQILGLTATPYRKDGHQAIIHMQCGPVRSEIAASEGTQLEKKVVVRETAFKMPSDLGPQPPIHILWEHLVSDSARLKLVAQDLRIALENGRFPLIISERKEHLELLDRAIQNACLNLKPASFTLIGGTGKRARRTMLDDISKLVQSKQPGYILATGAFIGEGFDLPALDTLVIAMPISFKGKLIQYAGRLHRQSDGKTEVLIHDYLDSSSALTVSMFKKRAAAYRKMGYSISMPQSMNQLVF